MIYTPRAAIDLLEYQFQNPYPAPGNKSTCTKVMFHGYEISIAMDSSHGPGDLSRSDIRVYRDNRDVSEDFHAPDCNMIYGTAEELFRVMKAIEQRENDRVE